MNLRKKALIALAAMTLGSFGNVYASNLAADFKNPSADNRPLTRWWVPGSRMTKAEIRAEIESMAAAGFGGAEVVPVASDGGDGNANIEWGDKNWRELSAYMLEVAGENNFTIDFTMTPAWPLALPTVKNVNDFSQGAQMELDGAWIDGITKNNPYSGDLPVSDEAVKDSLAVNGKIQLIGVTVAKYADKDKKILDYDSARTIKASNGKVTFKPKDNGEYVLFAWYQHPSGNVKYGNNQIDHFSRAGSQMIIDYWEENLLPAYGDNFKNVRSLFIDSLEFETHLDWTPGLAEGFKKARGYDLIKYLPAVYDKDAIGNYMGDPQPDFKFNKNNDAIKNDFREYLTQLYIENHVKPLKEFCNRHGVNLRYQTAYGKSLEAAQTALYPDIPETETLYGNDYLDFYRLQAGAVHVADKNIYSLETAAEWTEQWNPRGEDGEFKTRGNGEKSCGNYQQTFQDHIWHDQRAYSAGVNQVVFHGYAYNGQFGNGFLDGVKWPGFDGFSPTTWSNSFGERQPNWIYAKTYLDFLTRNQFILRQGKPRVDLAIYYQSYYENIDFMGSKKILDDGGILEQHGYSYDFISPAALEKISVTGKILDAEGAAYKAIILNNQQNLTDSAAKKFLEFARAGLPIVIVGKAPQDSAFVKDKNVSANVQKLLKMPSVIRVESTDKIFDALQKNNIKSDAAYERAGLLSFHRNLGDVNYYYLYNYGGVGSFRDVPEIPEIDTTVYLRGEGKPYRLNAWTGEIEPLAYTKTADGVAVKINLVGNDSALVALTDENIATIQPVKKNFDMPEITLTNWDLTIESWTKGDTPATSNKKIIRIGKIPALKAWKEIKNLENVSGVGIYRTDFNLGRGDLGAVLELGGAKDTFELKINGEIVPLDPIEGKVDISQYIRRGNNTVEISVASTLLNAVLKENTNDLRDTDNYGLFGAVIVRPYSVSK